MTLLQIIAGLTLLAFGGDLLVRGAVGAAERLRLPAFVAGLLFVGFGTSMPELITSLNANFRDAADLAVGNVIGSNIANILLILGVAAVMVPLRTDPGSFSRDGPALAAATAACIAFAVTGEFGRVTGLLFTIALLVYITVTFLVERITDDAQTQMHGAELTLAQPIRKTIWYCSVTALIGLGLLLLGASWTVNGSVSLARDWGVSEAMIGLSVVAIGTSLPELAASTVAAARKEADLAIGNVIGSNMFNLLGILGITAMVKPLVIAPNVLHYDLWILAAATLLLILSATSRWRISRREGGIFLFLYAGYMGFLVTRQGAAA